MSNKRLAGKVAIVTGAGCVGPGWGNGRAIAYRFAQEGARVFAVDLSMEAMSETLEKVASIGGEITPYQCDVTDSAAVQRMVDACVETYGTVDILVNNVGAPCPGGAMALTEEQWDSQLGLNLKTVFIVSRCVLPIMKEKSSGAIVNIA